MGDTEKEQARRVTLRIPLDVYAELFHWATAKDMSVNEYIADAIRYKCAYDAHDFDVPDLLLQRISQVIEGQVELSSRIDNVSDIVTSSMRSLLALTRGDNYLLDYEGDDGHGAR